MEFRATSVNPRYLLLNVRLKATVALSLRIGTPAYPWRLSNCQKLSFNLKRYVYLMVKTIETAVTKRIGPNQEMERLLCEVSEGGGGTGTNLLITAICHS